MGEFAWSSVSDPGERKVCIAHETVQSLALGYHQSLRPDIARTIFNRALTDCGYTVYPLASDAGRVCVECREGGKRYFASFSSEQFGVPPAGAAPFSIEGMKPQVLLLSRDILLQRYKEAQIAGRLMNDWMHFRSHSSERLREEISCYGDLVLFGDDPFTYRRNMFETPAFLAASARVPDVTYLKAMEFGEGTQGPKDPERLLGMDLYGLSQRRLPSATTLDRFFCGVYLAEIVRRKGLVVLNRKREMLHPLANLERVCIRDPGCVACGQPDPHVPATLLPRNATRSNRGTI